MGEKRGDPGERGNHDANAVAHARLATEPTGLQPTTLEILADLPIQREYRHGEITLWMTHAVPGSTKSAFHPEGIPKAFKRAVRYVAPTHLVVGHLHSPVCSNYRGIWVLNPGSVCRGRPKDSHTCALLDLKANEYSVFCVRTRAMVWSKELSG